MRGGAILVLLWARLPAAIHHRLVYPLLEEEKIVKVLRMWTHYE
jgi:Txe/YoeB family toxin of Txe-Axe toxin-antitoxin module